MIKHRKFSCWVLYWVFYCLGGSLLVGMYGCSVNQPIHDTYYYLHKYVNNKIVFLDGSGNIWKNQSMPKGVNYFSEKLQLADKAVGCDYAEVTKMHDTDFIKYEEKVKSCDFTTALPHLTELEKMIRQALKQVSEGEDATFNPTLDASAEKTQSVKE